MPVFHHQCLSTYFLGKQSLLWLTVPSQPIVAVSHGGRSRPHGTNFIALYFTQGLAGHTGETQHLAANKWLSD